MARVLWIRPPLRGLFPTINTGGQARNFPVGLAYLNAVAKSAGHSSTILDCLSVVSDSHVIEESELSGLEKAKVERFPRPGKRLFHIGARWSTISRAIKECAPDVVGISCMFSCYHLAARRVAEIAKQVLPTSVVIVGGQHVTSLPESVLEGAAVDCIFMGEAESSVPDLLTHASNFKHLATLPGVGYRCDGRFCSCTIRRCEPHLNARLWNRDLDALPFPDPGALNWKDYGQTAVLITSRGCPLACTFCSVHDMVGKQFRSRSPRNVVDEIEYFVERYSVRRFNIEDDNFTWDIPRVREICRLIRSRGLKVELYLPNGITAIRLDQNVIDEMLDAGFRKLFLGLETTDPQTLRRIQKGFTSLESVEGSVRAFRAKDHRIVANASLIIGLPGQNVRDVADDVVRLMRRHISYFANPYYAVPGSPDRQRLIDAGKLDPTEDTSMVEPWSFHESFEIDSETLYWTQLAAYVLRHADVAAGFLRFAACPAVDLRRAQDFAVWLSSDQSVADWRNLLERFAPRSPPTLSDCEPESSRGRRGSTPTSVSQAFSFAVPIERVDEMQCEPHSVWDVPNLETVGHSIAADFIAMACSLATNSSVAVDELQCANAEPKRSHCVFCFDGHLSTRGDAVRRAFVDAALSTAAASLAKAAPHAS